MRLITWKLCEKNSRGSISIISYKNPSAFKRQLFLEFGFPYPRWIQFAKKETGKAACKHCKSRVDNKKGKIRLHDWRLNILLATTGTRCSTSSSSHIQIHFPEPPRSNHRRISRETFPLSRRQNPFEICRGQFFQMLLPFCRSWRDNGPKSNRLWFPPLWVVGGSRRKTNLFHPFNFISIFSVLLLIIYLPSLSIHTHLFVPLILHCARWKFHLATFAVKWKVKNTHTHKRNHRNK